MKKQKQIAIAMVAILLLSVSMVPVVMSGLGDENVTNITNVNETNETVIEVTVIEETIADSGAEEKVNISQLISLGEAVDYPGLWVTGGDDFWFGQTTTWWYDGDAAQSGYITHNGQTWMETTVSGPDTLSFYWKVSSESGCDFLTFYIDGIEQDSISGDILWEKQIYPLDPGLHTLTWEYTKDGSVSSGEDCGWVDEVEIGVPLGICPAIEDGVAWLVRQQNADGSWGASYPVAETAFAVLKLETHATDSEPPEGCGYGLDSPFDPAYPYADNVQRGLDYIFDNANINIIDIGTQTHDGSVDNPDTNGNGKGVYFSGRRTYETSIALMAIAASRTPNRIVNVPGSPVNGWTYKDVAQDTVDYLAWGQTDSGYGRGGWSYAEMDNAGDRSDNSNTGFVVLGLLYAESNEYAFKIPIPQFVRDELNIWIDYIQCKEAGTNYGGSGYESNPCGWVNTLKAGNLLFEMAFVGDTIHTQRVIDAVNYIERHWDDNNMQPGWRGDPAHYQAMYCLMKGLETLGIENITVNRGGSDVKVNWFAEFADVLVSQQNADGSWNDCPSYVREGGDWGTHGGTLLCTEWALLTLQKEVPPRPTFCDPCVSIKVDVSINNNNGAIPYLPWNVFRYNVSVKNNQAYKPGKSRIAITYGLIDDPTSHTLIIGTRMPDIYLNDTYNISGDFRVPDDVYSGNYVFFASAFDLETGCCGCNAVPFSVEMPPWWMSTTSKEESWENWLEIVED